MRRSEGGLSVRADSPFSAALTSQSSRGPSPSGRRACSDARLCPVEPLFDRHRDGGRSPLWRATPNPSQRQLGIFLPLDDDGHTGWISVQPWSLSVTYGPVTVTRCPTPGI